VVNRYEPWRPGDGKLGSDLQDQGAQPGLVGKREEKEANKNQFSAPKPPVAAWTVSEDYEERSGT
jgi:hypothetical protein